MTSIDSTNPRKDVVFVRTQKGEGELSSSAPSLSLRERSVLYSIDGNAPASQLVKWAQSVGNVPEILVKLAREKYIQRKAAPSTLVPRASAVPPAVQPFSNQYERIAALKSFFNETIREMIGIRGIGLQLRVEKSYTLDEFRDLRGPYIEKVRKAKGGMIADMPQRRLDQLLEGSH